MIASGGRENAGEGQPSCEADASTEDTCGAGSEGSRTIQAPDTAASAAAQFTRSASSFRNLTSERG